MSLSYLAKPALDGRSQLSSCPHLLVQLGFFPLKASLFPLFVFSTFRAVAPSIPFTFPASLSRTCTRIYRVTHMAQPTHRKALITPYSTSYLPYEQRVRQGVPANLPAWAIPSVFTSRHVPISRKLSRRTISRENPPLGSGTGKVAAPSAQTKQSLSLRSSRVNAISSAYSTSSGPSAVIASAGIPREGSNVDIITITPKPITTGPFGTVSKPKQKTKVGKLRAAKSSKPEPATPERISAALKRRQKGDKVSTKLKNAGEKKRKGTLVSYLQPKATRPVPPRRAIDCDRKTLARDILRSLGQPTTLRYVHLEDAQNAQISPAA
ncbi:hypothetical protein PENSPDRAFT_71717 [Peniophora sp. CONT]|nr:hypothetical protein PENSPDRAFT_71717 [Peniophora sp. CONT]